MYTLSVSQCPRSSRTIYRRQQHFDDNQKTCNSTIYTMLPTVVGVVVKRFNPEVITSQLKANPSNKLALWNELKTISKNMYSVDMLELFGVHCESILWNMTRTHCMK